MNTRRSPPSSHSQHSSHQVTHTPHAATSPSLTQKPTASSSAHRTRRSPAGSPGSQTAQSLPSLRDHLHPYLPPVPPDSGPSGLVALPSSATPAFGSGYPFQPYGSAPGSSQPSQPPQQSVSGFSYSHQPPPPLGYARAPPHHPPPARADDSDDEEPVAGPSHGRSRAFSGGRGTEGMKEGYDRGGEDHGGSGSGMDLDTEGPPKKKRRRQALSCTECKRRKIKCDRSQPCAPCTRRGEQAKCQWHIVEPVEKYISRHEFDELKMRLEYLEGIVLRGAGPSQVYQAQHPGYPPISSGPGSSHSQHPSQSLQPPPPATQPQPSHHSSVPGVAGPPPAQAPPSMGIHQLLSGATPSPTRSPVLASNRTQRDLERERELRHVRSSPAVGFNVTRDRKESLSNIPPPLPGMSNEPRRMGHQHSLSSSSVSSSVYAQESSGKSPSSSAATVRGKRRSRSPR